MYTTAGNKRKALKLAFLAVFAALTIVACHVIFGHPSFNPAKVARAETRMWQAYYTGDRATLGAELISLLRNQYGLSLFEAKKIAELLANSAMKFSSGNSEDYGDALMLLARAYKQIKVDTGAKFDPDKVALAEMAWWTARRIPGQNSPEQVGRKIAELYSLLYGSDHPSFEKAGLLRARAAALRDAGGKNADWPRIEQLLKESYTELGKEL